LVAFLVVVMGLIYHYLALLETAMKFLKARGLLLDELLDVGGSFRVVECDIDGDVHGGSFCLWVDLSQDTASRNGVNARGTGFVPVSSLPLLM
jgi:hypothetical protein